ncbi:hypothetical protein CRENBAI_001828 [Crenichthys baileyi]|uniref:Uncharacterized protein n=1 Tax=Crenichthys baileyi TaxID=28760 RepID=A0AAV9S5R9_9TELE
METGVVVSDHCGRQAGPPVCVRTGGPGGCCVHANSGDSAGVCQTWGQAGVFQTWGKLRWCQNWGQAACVPSRTWTTSLVRVRHGRLHACVSDPCGECLSRVSMDLDDCWSCVSGHILRRSCLVVCQTCVRPRDTEGVVSAAVAQTRDRLVRRVRPGVSRMVCVMISWGQASVCVRSWGNGLVVCSELGTRTAEVLWLLRCHSRLVLVVSAVCLARRVLAWRPGPMSFPPTPETPTDENHKKVLWVDWWWSSGQPTGALRDQARGRLEEVEAGPHTGHTSIRRVKFGGVPRPTTTGLLPLLRSSAPPRATQKALMAASGGTPVPTRPARLSGLSPALRPPPRLVGSGVRPGPPPNTPRRPLTAREGASRPPRRFLTAPESGSASEGGPTGRGTHSLHQRSFMHSHRIGRTAVPAGPPGPGLLTVSCRQNRTLKPHTPAPAPGQLAPTPLPNLGGENSPAPRPSTWRQGPLGRGEVSEAHDRTSPMESDPLLRRRRPSGRREHPAGNSAAAGGQASPRIACRLSPVVPPGLDWQPRTGEDRLCFTRATRNTILAASRVSPKQSLYLFSSKGEGA